MGGLGISRSLLRAEPLGPPHPPILRAQLCPEGWLPPPMAPSRWSSGPRGASRAPRAPQHPEWSSRQRPGLWGRPLRIPQPGRPQALPVPTGPGAKEVGGRRSSAGGAISPAWPCPVSKSQAWPSPLPCRPALSPPSGSLCPHCPGCQATRKQGLGRGSGSVDSW